jgi:hypothetical protein
LPIEFHQTHSGYAFGNTERNAFLAECDDLHCGAGCEPDEVTGVELDFDTRFAIGCDGVTFHQGIVQTGAFPVAVALSFEIDFTRNKADANNAGIYVVFVCFIVKGSGCWGDKTE